MRPAAQEPPSPAPPAAWEELKRLPAELQNMRSYLFKASLNYISPERMNRLTFELWGNFDYPVRLDVKAGIGSTVALWREDDEGWLAYFPGQNVTYRGQAVCDAPGDRQPLPFALRELASLFSGRLGAVLPPGYESWETGENGGVQYFFIPGARLSRLTLDPNGMPLSLSGLTPEPWTLTFDAWEGDNGPKRPVKMTLRFEEGTRSIIRVKEAEFRTQPRDPESLALTPPSEARTIRFEELPDTDFLCTPSS